MKNRVLSVVASIAIALMLLSPGLTLDLNQFKQRLTTEVSAPFSTCMSNYNAALTYLSQLLAAYKPEDMMPPAVTPQLAAAVNNFVSNIKVSSANSHALAQVASKAVVDQTNLVSQQEAKIQQAVNLITQKQVEVKGDQQQVALSQQALTNAQRNLNTLQAALRSAQDRYDHAKSHCLGKKRRKRGLWHHITHVVHKVVDIPKKVVHEAEKGICKTLNVLTNQITKARHDVDNAQNQVNAASAQLAQHQRDLDAAQGELATHQREKATLESQKTPMVQMLTALKATGDKIEAVAEKMKRTTAYIDNIKSSGAVAKDVLDLGYIIDPTNLVQPLTEIGTVMNTLTGQSGKTFLPSMTPAQIQALLNQINAIKAKVQKG